MRAMVITILAIAIVVVWQLWRDSSSAPSSPANKPTSKNSTPAPAKEAPEEKQEDQKPPEPSPLIAELHHPDTSVKRDLEILHQVFDDYRLIAETGNPSGNNLEITSALTGNNRYGLAPIPRNHPAISPRGELRDRLGTPYFFHNLSAQHLEIQSAGPDKRHHTDDDILISNLPATPQTP